MPLLLPDWRSTPLSPSALLPAGSDAKAEARAIAIFLVQLAKPELSKGKQWPQAAGSLQDHHNQHVLFLLEIYTW